MKTLKQFLSEYKKLNKLSSYSIQYIKSLYKNNGFLYHGSSTKFLESIKTNGLKAPIYITPSEENAKYYALLSGKDTNSEPIIFKIPAKYFKLKFINGNPSYAPSKYSEWIYDQTLKISNDWKIIKI